MTISVRSLSTLAGLLALNACASLSPTALTKLAGLDPLEISPEQVSVAAVMPVPLRLRSGDVTLRLKVDAPEPSDRIDETLFLEVVSGDDAPGVSVSPPFERVQVARIAEADRVRLAAAQAKARALRATGNARGTGSLSVMVGGGCRDGVIGSGALKAQIYMRSKAEDGYFRLSSIDLRKLIPENALAMLPSCEGAKR